MNAKELEKYILSKQDSRKRAIHDLRYVRYTVYCSPFATIHEHNNRLVLTVFGRYPQYETDYPEFVKESEFNEPRHFTDIYFTENIPDSVIENMIDCSYLERLKQIVRPRSIVHKAERIRYCGIVSGYTSVDEHNTAKRTSAAPDEVFSKMGLDDYRFTYIKKEEEEPPVELEGIGEFNSLPYSLTEKDLKKFKNLRNKLKNKLHGSDRKKK